MSVIQSQHNPNSEESLSNQDFNKKLVEELENRITDSSKGGRSEMVEQHKERGKLLPRERIEELIDPDTPFLELSSLAAFDLYLSLIHI